MTINATAQRFTRDSVTEAMRSVGYGSYVHHADPLSDAMNGAEEPAEAARWYARRAGLNPTQEAVARFVALAATVGNPVTDSESENGFDRSEACETIRAFLQVPSGPYTSVEVDALLILAGLMDEPEPEPEPETEAEISRLARMVERLTDFARGHGFRG